MTSSQPTVSATITNFNYAGFLPKAIESILGQSYTDYELIIIDNASTDDSLDVIAGYANSDPRIRVVAHERNIGALASLRESCDVALGTYRVHVDADDWVISPTAFERQVAMLDDNPHATFVYSAMTMFGADGQQVLRARPYAANVMLSGAEALEAVLGFTLTHSGMMVRLDAYRASGGYPAGFDHVDDMLLGVRLCELGDVGYIDDELYAFRQHGDNIHLKPQRSIVRDEYLPVIDAAFAGPLGSSVAPGVRERATRRALVHMPTHYIFRGELKTGWMMWWESVKLRPHDTVLQPRTISLVARTLLGDRGTSALRRWSGR